MSTNSIVTSAPTSITAGSPKITQQVLVDNAGVVVNTTTVDRTVGSVVTGVSIIPYMRPLAIDFVGFKLRPNRELWFYFDDTGVNRFIQRPNIVEVNSSNVVDDMRTGPQRNIQIGSSVARILHVERNLDSGNAVFYVSEFTNASNVNTSSTLTVQGNTYSATVKSYQHNSGFVQINSQDDAILFSADAEFAGDDYFVGNTITILGGTNTGQSAEIVSYNSAIRTAYVEPRLKIDPKETNLIYTIGDYRTWYSSNTYPSSYTTPRGIVSGVLHIPDPNKNPQTRFRTGEKTFTIVDNPYFVVTNPEFGQGSITTRADYRFISNGLDQSIAQIIDRDVFIRPVPSPTPTPSVTPRVTPSSTGAPVSATPPKTPTPTGTPNATPRPTIVPGSSPPPSDTPPKTPPKTPSNTKKVPPITTPKISDKPEKPPVSPSRTPACQPKFVERREPLGRGEFSIVRRCESCCPPASWNIQYKDPISQTFFVRAEDFPDGIFVSSVDLFFKNKGELLPVEVQLRPVVNGQPSAEKIIPGATTTVEIEDIKVSNFPNTSNSMTATKFTFPSPVYLSPSYEYAIVALTDDYGYDYYSAELGGTVIGTDRKISKQPFLGSFFKSQNGVTWTPLQNEDLMFVLNRANFTSTSGTAIFDEDKVQLLREVSSNVAYNAFDDVKANTYYDAFELRSDAIEINNTQLQYYFKGASNSSKTLASTYSNFNADKRFDLEERNVLFNPQLSNQSMSVRVDLSTKNPVVSPVIYQNRQNMVTIENLINDTGLTPDRFVITNPGIDYDEDNASIIITSTTGYGANAWAVADSETGNIVSVVVDSPGVGYVGDVTATVVGPRGTGATLAVSTETGSSGGPALARYISKTVTLLDGFDAGDLRVFLTAVKPPGANVNIYYKVRNSLDPNPIEDRNWVRMTQKTSQYSFSVNRNPVEYEYRPSLTSNNITYSTQTTTYKTFNQFAIKIVLSSRSTVANGIPYILDVRAIAMPEDVY
jgi:hypothetical protein